MLSQRPLMHRQGHHGPSFSDQSLALSSRQLAGPHGPGPVLAISLPRFPSPTPRASVPSSVICSKTTGLRRLWRDPW